MIYSLPKPLKLIVMGLWGIDYGVVSGIGEIGMSKTFILTTVLEIAGYWIIVDQLGWLVAFGVAFLHIDILISIYSRIYRNG